MHASTKQISRLEPLWKSQFLKGNKCYNVYFKFYSLFVFQFMDKSRSSTHLEVQSENLTAVFTVLMSWGKVLQSGWMIKWCFNLSQSLNDVLWSKMGKWNWSWKTLKNLHKNLKFLGQGILTVIATLLNWSLFFPIQTDTLPAFRHWERTDWTGRKMNISIQIIFNSMLMDNHPAASCRC